MKKFREWLSIRIVKKPRFIVLLGVLTANVVFIGAAALIISWLTPESMEGGGFGNSIFNTIMMYLGIGGIDTVIEDISQADMFLVLFCIFIVLIGLVFFTYALIGYMSEIISNFIGEADSSSRRLRISNHTVILNWNTRAAELLNELLYKNTREKVVVLVGSNKDEVLCDINERLSDTMDSENGLKNKLTIIVREGDSWSAKQLNDISIKRAKSVIILCDTLLDGADETTDAGNTRTIKTLLQVAQLMEEEDANQQIVVEVEDERTLALVNTIVGHKLRKGKCNIVPFFVDRLLGHIFSQFAIMPELNVVYSSLFSNKGASFFAQTLTDTFLSETDFVSGYMDSHPKAIPLTAMRNEDKQLYGYYVSANEQDICVTEPARNIPVLPLSLNPHFEMRKKQVLILGHNSKSPAIMEGFDAFSREWTKKDGEKALQITVIDDESSLEKQDGYKAFPCVRKVVAADIFEIDLIRSEIDAFIGAHGDERCILILSDDTVPAEEADADALTYLILVQDMMHNRLVNDPHFDPAGMDMIVEILNPKNYDIVSSYSANNIVISNRYVSKMMMQISENKALFELYLDILTYDGSDAEDVDTKEIYIKKAADYFSELPPPCSAAELIKAVWQASPDDNKTVVLGYFHANGQMVLFEGELSKIRLSLSAHDKLIVFSDN
jgi:ABC-type phosphate transport system, permease component